MSYAPFTTTLINNDIVLKKNDIYFSANNVTSTFVYFRGGLRIGKTTFAKETPLHGSEKEIIEQIHAIRFNKENPYVITGGHFSPLFVRNLGIFYNALVDPRIPSNATDWLKRQEIALKTVAFDLAVFQLAGKEYTTIYPVKKNIFTCRNLYARPSDSLFAILYTICALTDDSFIENLFPAKSTKQKLQTKKAAHQLLKAHAELLKKLLQTYVDEVIDNKTKLVKKTLLLASARDGIKRESSFYDNVIVWATIRLAKRLALFQINETELEAWKKCINHSFWDENEGIFLDDLSELTKKQKLFSADSFIVLSTGFLNPKVINDKNYLMQMVNYVKKNKLDQPFPLQYSTCDLPEKLYRPVRHFAPSYMGTSIWSHWGMEYIKTLIYLGNFSDAKKHLDSYKENMQHYGGYPEVYDKNGKLLQTRLYRSVLQNGWVINYEQTQMLYMARASLI